VPSDTVRFIGRHKNAHLTAASTAAWYFYRCRSCDHTDWVEDIAFFAFPHAKPGEGPVLCCPECGGEFVLDPSKPQKLSFDHPT
jgi:hypothetical protein